MYIELGAITDDLNSLAKKYQFPAISAAQLNRAAYNVLDSTKADKLKKLNNSYVSESTKIIENTDYFLFINKEMNTITEEQYLAFSCTKIRGNDSNVNVKYFIHPFENNMKLKPDIDLPQSLSKMSLEEDVGRSGSSLASERPRRLLTPASTVSVVSSNNTNSIPSLDDLLDD
jgi:hypothetical protein